ncbi:MAG: hypothetical protein QG555_645 [Thermodesulfobacteriota bacterium]|nr:hypothetical protein [Thermodesulfobacteriota bacterium]
MAGIDIINKKNIKRLPVLDRGGKAVGMIYERYAFNVIAEAMFDEGKSGTP